MAEPDLDLAMLSERIFRRRRQLGLEQQDVADRAGLSVAYISRLERGRIPNPKWGDLRAVARALEMRPDALMREGASLLTPEDERELQQLLALPELAPEFAAFARSYEESTEEERRWLLRSLRIIADRHGLR
jgi:transcriptional regulator with XRE-family HTH domain